MQRMTRGVLTFLLIAAAACGDEEPANNDTANNTTANTTTANNATANHTTTNNTTTSGDTTLTVDGWTVEFVAVNPPLEAGAEVFQLTVTDADGVVEPTEFVVDAFMSAHGHGTMVPTVTANTAPGVYEATVTFSMPGPWEVLVDTDDDRSYEFNVEVHP